jgi:Peptidase family M23
MGRRKVQRRLAFAVVSVAALLGAAGLAARVPAGAATGQVPIGAFPVDGTCSYADTWLAPRAGVDKNGNANVHEGVDVIASSGVPIRAVTDGQITRLSTSARGGIQLYLTQPDGTYFFHGHLSRYADGLVEGTKVHAGDVIGYVGQTGDAVYSVAHLHFEVHPAWNGKAPINPFPVIRQISGCGRTGTGTATSLSTGSTDGPTTTTTSAKPAPSTTGSSDSTVPPSTTTTAFPLVPTSNSYSGPMALNGFDGFLAVSPSRVADTRSRFYLTPLSTMTQNYLTVASRGSVPTNASAVMLNLTVSGPADDGWMRVWPCGQPTPATSNVNFRRSQTISNTALIALGTSGRVCFQASTGIDLAVDVLGWNGAGGTNGFVAAGPNRLFDSRDSGVVVAAGAVRTIDVPASDAASVTLTAVEPSANGEITIWPCAEQKPSIAGLQMTFGVTAANTTVVPLKKGKLCVSPSVATHVIVDMNGSWRQKTGGRPTAISPVRLLDTRGTAGKPAPLAEVRIPMAGKSGIPADATSVQVNVTVTQPNGPGYVTVWPCGGQRPQASVLNYGEGVTVANATLVGLGGGALCVASSDSAHLVVDVTGYLS